MNIIENNLVCNKTADIITESHSFSKINAKGNSLRRLTTENNNFVPLEISTSDDGETAIFSFDLAGLTPLSNIKNETKADKFRILSNVFALHEMLEQFDFTLNPAELYYTYNLRIKIKKRDLKLSNKSINELAFLNEYKALCAYVFDNKHDYLTYLQGGTDLAEHIPIIKEINSTAKCKDLALLLLTNFLNEQHYTKTNKIIIHKWLFGFLIFSCALSVILIVLMLLFG